MKRPREASPAPNFHLPSIPVLAGILGWAGLAIYVFCVLCFCPLPDPGDDTEHFQHWASANFEYASSPVDLSVMSPFQGLGGLVQPLAVWMNPAYIVPKLLAPAEPRAMGTAVAMILMVAATFLLARALGMPSWLALAAGQIVAIFSLIPTAHLARAILPLNGVALYELIWGTAVPPALETLLLAIFCFLGRQSRRGNVVCIVLMPLLLVYTILCDPLYSAMFSVTFLFFFAGVFLGSQSRQVFLWRAAGGIACASVLLALNIHNFYRALVGYAARAVFPNELYCEIQHWHFTGLIFQGRFATAGMILLIFCCVLTCLLGNRQMRAVRRIRPGVHCLHHRHLAGLSV